MQVQHVSEAPNTATQQPCAYPLAPPRRPFRAESCLTMVSKTLALSALMFVRLAALCAAEETGAPSSADNDVSAVAMHSPSSDSET